MCKFIYTKSYNFEGKTTEDIASFSYPLPKNLFNKKKLKLKCFDCKHALPVYDFDYSNKNGILTDFICLKNERL